MQNEATLYETLDELWTRLPYQASRCEFEDDSGWAAYAARWHEEEFKSMFDFVHFCFCYSSIMQFVIANQKRLAAGLRMYRDEALDWFVPNEAPKAYAQKQLDGHGTSSLDAAQWVAMNLNFVEILWLNVGDHDTTLVVPSDEYSDLYSFGKKGYLTVFAINN